MTHPPPLMMQMPTRRVYISCSLRCCCCSLSNPASSKTHCQLCCSFFCFCLVPCFFLTQQIFVQQTMINLNKALFIGLSKMVVFHPGRIHGGKLLGVPILKLHHFMQTRKPFGIVCFMKLPVPCVLPSDHQPFIIQGFLQFLHAFLPFSLDKKTFSVC